MRQLGISTKSETPILPHLIGSVCTAVVDQKNQNRLWAATFYDPQPTEGSSTKFIFTWINSSLLHEHMKNWEEIFTFATRGLLMDKYSKMPTCWCQFFRVSERRFIQSHWHFFQHQRRRDYFVASSHEMMCCEEVARLSALTFFHSPSLGHHSGTGSGLKNRLILTFSQSVLGNATNR